MKLSTLVEHVADWHAHLEVDRTNRLVRNVALTGGQSKNGYRYAEQALREAASLYDQRPVFLDHAADKSRPQERSTRDLVGSIINPRYESGRIRGDIRVLDTDSGRTFLALAESDAPGVGMSHVVLAERSKPDGEVSRIHDVVSVDAVVFPATTTTFRETHDTVGPSESDLTANKEQAATDTSRPASDLTPESTTDHATVSDEKSDTNRSHSEPDKLHQRLQELQAERDELFAQLHQERLHQSAEQQERAIAELLSESGLPDYAVTESFRLQLTAADNTRRRDLLQERLTLIETARRRPPLSRERVTSSDAQAPDAAFVATIKQQTS